MVLGLRIQGYTMEEFHAASTKLCRPHGASVLSSRWERRKQTLWYTSAPSLMWETKEQFSPSLFCKSIFWKAAIFPNNAGHFRHYTLSCLVAEIAYPVLEDYKQSLWSVHLICISGEGKIITWKGQRVSTAPPKGIFLRGFCTKDPGASREEQSIFDFESLMFTPDFVGSLRKSGDQRDGGGEGAPSWQDLQPLRSPILCFSYKSL